MIHFVEELLKHKLSLAHNMDLQIEHEHRVLGPTPREGAPPRSTVQNERGNPTNSVAEEGLYLEK